MSSKPAQVRYLTGGISLGAAIHKGWAASWNWVLSWVAHFAAGNGCKLSNGDKGHPRLDVLLEAGDGIEISGGGKGQAFVISATSGGGEGGGEGEGEESEWDDGNHSVLADVQYDTTTRTFQKKFASVTVENGRITEWVEDEEWTDVFEAEQHSAEVS